MKKKHGIFFGFAVILFAAIFTIAGCGNPAGGDDDEDGSNPPQSSFSVSGKFTKSGGAGSGEVAFSLKSDAASAGRAVTAESYTIGGVLEDGDFTIRLKGSYDPNKGTWSVSAKSSAIIYTLDGSVDSEGNSRGSTATIAVKSGDEWVPYVFPIKEDAQTVTVPDADAVNGENGIPAFAQGWWKLIGSGGGYSWNASVLLSPWKIKGTITTTDPNGTVFLDEIEYSLVEIVSGSGKGPYVIYYTWPEYVMTTENLAKAASQCLFGNENSVTPLTNEQADQLFNGSGMPGSPPKQPYVWYNTNTDTTYWSGFTTDQIDTFFEQNYWKKWATAQGVTQSNKYGASKVSFNDDTAPTSFSITNLVQVGSSEEWYYTHSFGTLKALKAATLVEEYEWDWATNPPKKGDVSVQTLKR
jgi:hypothetical protein